MQTTLVDAMQTLKEVHDKVMTENKELKRKVELLLEENNRLNKHMSAGLSHKKKRKHKKKRFSTECENGYVPAIHKITVGKVDVYMWSITNVKKTAFKAKWL